MSFIEGLGSAIGSAVSGISKTGAEVGKGAAVPSMASLGIGRAIGTADIAAPDLGGIFKPASELAFIKQLVSVKPIGEIVFNPLKEVDVVAQAESILFQAQLEPAVSPKPSVRAVEPTRLIMLPQIEPRIVPFVTANEWRAPFLETATYPLVESVTKTENALGVQVAVESVNKQETETLVKPSLEQQKTEEKLVTERVTTKQIDKVESSKNKKRKRFVVDWETLIKRLREVGSALPKAKLEARRLGYGTRIIGWVVEKLLVLGHTEDLSKIVRPQGPDGTLSLIHDAIRAKREFNSEKEIMAVILKHRPVSEEEKGEPVSNEEVRKVTQNLFVKPVSEATELVEERITKKVEKLPDQRSVQTFVVEKTPVKTGATIEDLGLTEVFPKAV